MLKVDALIVAALQMEYEAAKSIGTKVDGTGVEAWDERDGDSPSPYLIGKYDLPNRRSLSIALARPTRMGGGATAPLAASLVERLKPTCLAMCGVCAGNPLDTALGDVIISEMVYAYDEGKRTDQGFQGDYRQTMMNDTWVRSAQELKPYHLPSYGPATADEAELWLLDLLYRGVDPRRHPARSRFFPAGMWGPSLRQIQNRGVITRIGRTIGLTDAGRSKVDESQVFDIDPPEHLPFAIHVGPIASGNVVVKDGLTWDMLKANGVRTVLGLEMEAATIGSIAHRLQVPRWVVTKGVMDHADPAKDD
ncbi:MAG TPA: hypothetical protein VN838_14555, partial [Bradyrhizobium sp.]|nr:hypothetical protein [Bradyrhizobium sp.]